MSAEKYDLMCDRYQDLVNFIEDLIEKGRISEDCVEHKWSEYGFRGVNSNGEFRLANRFRRVCVTCGRAEAKTDYSKKETKEDFAANQWRIIN